MPFEIKFEDPRIGFASAHFIIGHEKCGRLHGHNYFIKVIISGDLDENHMVVDYAVLKNRLRELTEPFDHRVLIPKKAKELDIVENEKSIEIRTCNKRYVIPSEDAVFIDLPATTSEELAKYFHAELKKIWPDYKITVDIEESPGASATFSD